MKHKICSKCKQKKTVDKFTWQRSRSGKLYPRGDCKVCWWKRQKNFYLHNNEAKHKTCLSKINYKYTKSGVLATIYDGQKRHFYKKKKSFQPNYSLESLRNKFMFSSQFNRLYNRWKKSGYNSWLKPSVDRINSKNGYRLNNLQILTWKQNCDKGRLEARIPITIRTKTNKILAKFKSKNDLIRKVLKSSGIIFV